MFHTCTVGLHLWEPNQIGGIQARRCRAALSAVLSTKTWKKEKRREQESGMCSCLTTTGELTHSWYPVEWSLCVLCVWTQQIGGYADGQRLWWQNLRHADPCLLTEGSFNKSPNTCGMWVLFVTDLIKIWPYPLVKCKNNNCTSWLTTIKNLYIPLFFLHPLLQPFPFLSISSFSLSLSQSLLSLVNPFTLFFCHLSTWKNNCSDRVHSVSLSLCALLSHTSSPRYHSLRSRGNHTVWTKCATNLSDDVCFPPPTPLPVPLFSVCVCVLTLSTNLTKCCDTHRTRTSTAWKFAASLLK